MNEHDSEKISGLLAHRGMVPTTTPQQADLFILNTCSVREKASQKIYSRLGELKSRKEQNPNFLIGVVGCVAQQESEEMAKRVPFVDLVVGTHMYHTIPDLLDEIDHKARHPRQGAQLVETSFLDNLAPVEMPHTLRGNPFRANITIMEGCNKHCSFCIVPFTRGKERNRASDQIVEEAKIAVSEGYSEILLLGQTVNSYRDPASKKYRFSDLLEELSSVNDLRRIRFTSPHPKDFDSSTIRVIAQNRNICNQVHLPVQSGSNSVLKRMRRQYTRERFLEIVKEFLDCGRRISLSTDVIVGSPGESEQDFENTISLIEKVQFESIYSFKYSPRPYTEAYEWEDDVPSQVKRSRLMTLQELQAKIQLNINLELYVGRTFEVLVEGLSRDGIHQFGRTTSNRVINFPGAYSPGEFVSVQVNQAGPYSLKGTPLTEPGKQ